MDSDDAPPLPIPPRKDSADPPTKPRRSYPKDPASGSAFKDLTRLLAYEERETRHLHRTLLGVREQLRAEQLRADDAERKAQDAINQIKIMNDARLAALAEAARANEELKLYKVQLAAAQQEIFRAQDVLKTVDAQRYLAEEDAAKARSRARRLNEERLIHIAKEEGRRMGMREGLQRGRDMGFQEARRTYYDFSRPQSEEERYDDVSQSRTPSPDERHFAPQDESESSSSSSPIYDESVPPPEIVPIPPPPRTRSDRSGSDIHPLSVHNATPSLGHPFVNIPPDNYIPETGPDSVIYLPPPHEFARPPPTPESSPAPSLPPIPEADEEPLMIPNPTASSHYRGHHRASSPESNSTTISQFDMVNAPAHYDGRQSPLSVIQEVHSVSTSPNPRSTKDTPGLERNPSLKLSGSSMNVPHITVGSSSSHQHGVYHRPRSSSSDSSDSSRARLPSGSSVRSKERRKSNASANSVPDITIQPPSRPQSGGGPKSSSSQRGPMGDFLSPADANRPDPLPDRSREGSSSSEEPAGSYPTGSGSTAPIVLPDGQLPPGFVPLATDAGFTPGHGFQPVPSADGFGASGLATAPDPMPGGLYDQQRQTPSQRSRYRREDVVIPDPSLSRGESESDDAVSSAFSDDTLTTPPRRAGGRRLKSNKSGSSASRFTGAGVPLPASTIGGSPWSNAGGSSYR